MSIQVLFLDIDGVLNSEASARFWHRKPIPGAYSGDAWCPIATSNLQVLLEEAPESMKIVVHSSWREGCELSAIKHIFTARGVDASRIIDRTPSLPDNPTRDTITKWLIENGSLEVADWLVLDDEPVIPYVTNRVIRVDPFVGLTLRQVFEIINRFNQGVPRHG